MPMIDSDTMKFRVTRLFKPNYNADTRFVVNQGGARSSKTFSIIQALIIKARDEAERCVYSIVRKTMPSLRGSAMRDFFEVLEAEGLYHEANHNKSEDIYRLWNVEFEFFGLDQPQKVRGRKRKLLWLNEANEFSFEDYFQLNLRTTGQVFMDYNPSDEFHWIYDQILTREDCTFIKSSYKDNPFLDKSLRDEIARLKDMDDNAWQVYGLGERGHKQNIIHPKWDYCDELPEEYDEQYYGLDFGFSSNPAAVVSIRIRGESVYLDEVLYERGLTNTALCDRMATRIPERSESEIVADSAEPKSIQEIAEYVRADGSSFNIQPAEKGPDSVRNGISIVNSFNLFITKRSVNILKEIKSYCWKVDKDGRILDEPVKFNDHLMNAMRYALQKVKLQQSGEVMFTV